MLFWSYGQSQITDTTIHSASPPLLPDSLKNRDAVVLSENSEMLYRISSFHNYSETLLGIHSFHRQIKILTRKGLEDYSFVTIPKTRYTEIDKLDVFLIKPDGSIVREKPQIIEVPDPYDDSRLKRGLLRFSIPGAEIGDIVDFTSKMTNPVGGGYPVELFFHEEIPILNSTTTLRFKNTVRFQIKCYNDLKIECDQSGRSDSIFQWKFPYLPAIYGTENGIRENELPFCRYMITGVRIMNSFKNITTLTPSSWGVAFLPIIKGITRSSPKQKKMNDPAAEQRGITGIFSIRPKGRGTNPIEIRIFQRIDGTTVKGL